MSKDTCIKANTYCPVHKGIVGADCWHDSKDFSVPRTDWKQVDEINTLREQVEKLKNRLNKDSQEFTILCAKETEKVLREQVEKLKAELASIDGALNDPRANLTLTTSEIIWELKEQLAALAEQNEKMREALKLARFDSLNMTLTDWDILKSVANLPDLASPVLNRIRAEGMWEAINLYSPDDSVQDWIDKMTTKAAELEKSNA